MEKLHKFPVDIASKLHVVRDKSITTVANGYLLERGRQTCKFIAGRSNKRNDLSAHLAGQCDLID
ncbi:hypothetical protein Ciccas_011686 [Cichlidogyrus casuarinus]|uniref:Uncharacterized protein n=1 Tax=Cichlidogyrus casuarinus TaxID=1844966 RepID=A0ABD2PRR7_9PLAT